MNVIIRPNSGSLNQNTARTGDLTPFSEDARKVLSQILSNAFVLSRAELMRNTRAPHDVARARNITMYVLHVQLGLSFADLGREFGRNRSTVKLVCQQVEDLRDDEDLDFLIDCISHGLWDWLDLARFNEAGEEVCYGA